MRDYPSDEAALQGALLAAHPGLRDPNFARTVILIAAYTEEDGALGFVMNRPTDRKVGELASGLPSSELEEVPVYLGGPVASNQLVFASLHWDGSQEELRYETHLEAEEATLRLGDPTKRVCAFLGYSGWTAGQLEDELKKNAWVVYPTVPELMEPTKLGGIWKDIMRRSDPWLRLLAEAPDDPGRN